MFLTSLLYSLIFVMSTPIAKRKREAEDVDDMFTKRPYSVIGNVYNMEDESEPVLGFYQVGQVESKPLYVNNEDLDLPQYSSSCELKEYIVDGEEQRASGNVYSLRKNIEPSCKSVLILEFKYLCLIC